MKSILVVLVSLIGFGQISQAAGGSLERELDRAAVASAWLKFRKNHGRVYESREEENMRMSIFEKRYREIVVGNSGNNSYIRAVNHLTDLTQEEVNGLNGAKFPEGRIKSVPRIGKGMLERLESYKSGSTPGHVDWSSDPSRVSPVKDQGHCGSCWAFATTGLFEGQLVTRANSSQVVMLSEQQLIDCDKYENGCHGGDPEQAVDYVISKGLMRELDYPYKSSQGVSPFTCGYDEKEVYGPTNLFESGETLEQSEDLLKNYVAHYGPVMVAIDASHSSFHDYKSGVYYDEKCSSEALDHAVLVVGYGTDKDHGDYWIIKNSWSESWGMKGYMYLARNRNNHCGVASMATIVN